MGSHPNILWTNNNRITPEAEALLLPSFRWSVEELAHMLRAVPHDFYGYGTLGECLDVLLYEDPNIVDKLHLAVQLLLADNEPEHTRAIRAASLSLSHAKGQQRRQLDRLKADYPVLMEEEWFEGIAAWAERTGDFSLY